MNFKNVASIAVLVVAVAFAIQLVGQNGVEARQSQSQAGAQTQNVTAQFEFAILRVDDTGDNVTFLVGGNERVRTETIRAAYQRLGGRGRTSFANLLNQIGLQGYSLVQVNGREYIFTRPAS